MFDGGNSIDSSALSTNNSVDSSIVAIGKGPIKGSFPSFRKPPTKPPTRSLVQLL